MLRMGKNKEALQYMNKAIAKNPANPGLYSNRSTCYLRLNNVQKALADINHAFDLMKGNVIEPPILSMMYFNRGSIYEKLKRDKEAFRDIKKSVEVWPLGAGAQFRLAEYYENEGKKDLAIRKYNAARQLYRDFGGGTVDTLAEIDKRIKKLGGQVKVVEQPKNLDTKPRD